LQYTLRTDTSPSAIYALALHDALPICGRYEVQRRHSNPCRRIRRVRIGNRIRTDSIRKRQRMRIDVVAIAPLFAGVAHGEIGQQDRKSTRLNSSHVKISYAVFCLKKKK